MRRCAQIDRVLRSRCGGVTNTRLGFDLNAAAQPAVLHLSTDLAFNLYTEALGGALWAD